MDLSDIKIESIVIAPKKSKESIKQRCIRLNAIYDDKISKRRIEGKEKIYDNNDEFNEFFNVVNIEDLLNKLCYKSHNTRIKKIRQFGRKSKKVSKIFQIKETTWNCEGQCNGLECMKSFVNTSDSKPKELLDQKSIHSRIEHKYNKGLLNSNTSTYTRKKYTRLIKYECDNFKRVNKKINELISKYPVRMLKIYGDDLLEYLYIKCFSELIDLFNDDINCYDMNYVEEKVLWQVCNKEYNKKYIKERVLDEKNIEDKISVCDRCNLLLDKK